MTRIDQRNKYCFCTLALGRNYCDLAKQLAHDLEQFAPESTLFILTDHPSIFKNVNNVDIVFHRKRSVVGYNDKLCVVKKALDRFDTCIFVDADIRILRPVQLDQAVFEPGITAFRVYTWQYLKNELKAEKDKRKDTNTMSVLRKKLNLPYADWEIPVVREFLFAITRCSKIDSFLRQWNDLAEICEKNRLFAREGYSIGLAGLLTGYPIYQNDFQRMHFFEPLMSLEDVNKGLMSQIEYESLEPSINLIKFPIKSNSSVSRLWMRIQNNISVIRLIKGLRFFKIKLFGLNLLK